MNTNDLWLEKYRPLTLENYIGKTDDIKQIKKWITNFFNKEIETEKLLLLYGNPGVGKTTLARIIFSMYDYEIVEFNTSNYRSKKMIKEKIGCIGKSSIINFNKGVTSLFKKIKLKKIGLLMDEVDGITTNQESSGIQELINIIDSKKDNNKMPIICTCNNIKNKKIKLLTKRALTIKLSNPKKSELKQLALIISKKEKLKISIPLLNKIIKNVNEYRELINLLYQISIFIKNGKKNKYIINSKIFKDNNINHNNQINNKENKYDDDNFSNNKDLIYLDNITSKLKHIFENNINTNDLLISCKSDNQLYTLSLDKNINNIIKFFNIPDNIRYTLYKYILNNLVTNEIINTIIFKNQYWDLYDYNNFIGCISIINSIKNNKTYFNKNNKNTNKNSISKKKKTYLYLEHHSSYNKMIQDIAFYCKRNNTVNNTLINNFDINGFYYIDKLNYLNSDNNYKNSDTIKINEETKKITKKITEYFSII